MIQENFNKKPQKKTVLRAPPRSIELMSNLDKLRDYQRIGEIKHYFYVRIILIITDLISLGIGIYIFVKFEDFLSKSYNFNHRKLLLSFVYIYSPSAIGIFIVSFFLSLFVYCFYCLCERKKIYGAPLYDENDYSKSFGSLEEYSLNESNEKNKVEVKEEYIGINADKVTLLPYTATIFVIMTIIFYFIALPLSIILLVNLWKDPIYRNKKKFWALYVLVFANLINGILIVIVFFHMFMVKRKENNILKNNLDIDENMIKSLRNEVREALKKPK